MRLNCFDFTSLRVIFCIEFACKQGDMALAVLPVQHSSTTVMFVRHQLTSSTCTNDKHQIASIFMLHQIDFDDNGMCSTQG